MADIVLKVSPDTLKEKASNIQNNIKKIETAWIKIENTTLGRTRLRQFVCLGHFVPRKEKHRRIASTVLKVCTFTQIAAAYRHPYAPEPAGPVPDDRAR